MTISYRIFHSAGYNRIEFNGQIFAEDTLCEELWIHILELEGTYMSKRERTKAQRQITQYRAMLDALRSAGA